MRRFRFDEFTSPIILEGDALTGYRDPTAIYFNRTLYLYYTMICTDPSGIAYWHVALSKSTNLIDWTSPRILTPKDTRKNFSSPGNVVRYNDQWILCLQTYPTPNGEKYGSQEARLWIMRSSDLETWSEPEILKVKGADTPLEAMGRMIDPFLMEDKDEHGKWWCFFKQNGVSMSYSYDLQNWVYTGNTESGENVCVLVQGNEYLLYHSPKNGIGLMHSCDMKIWNHSSELITLGQDSWEWAKGRITAGFVLDCKNIPSIDKFLMFFHASGPEDEQVFFANHASIGMAWSDDLGEWSWAGKR